MAEATALQIATLYIAILAVTLSVASLAWQIAQFALSGHRVKVELLLGAIGRGGKVTGAMTADLSTPMSQGFTSVVAVVRARNVGREPVTITGYDVSFGNGFAFSVTSNPYNPDLPHRLEPGTSVDFHTPFDQITAALGATRESGYTGPRRMKGRVTLATGRTVEGAWEQERRDL